MQDLWTIFFGTSIGLTLAGAVASCYHVVTQERLTFALQETDGAPALLLGMLLRVIAGPFLLAHSAYDALGQKDPNMPVIAGIFALAAMWGCLSGLIVIDLIGGFAPAAAAEAIGAAAPSTN